MEWRRRLGRVAALLPPTPSASPPVRLKSAADVLTLLEEQVNSVRGDPSLHPVAKARAVRVLASVALRAIETGNLEARIEMLETVLKQRKGEES